MKVIKGENNCFFDVDDTLTLTYRPSGSLYPVVWVKDPLTRHRSIKRYVHEPMVRLLKEEIHRGATVFVWSRGGYEWAAEVLKALKIKSTKLYVLSKPHAYFDDIPIEQWLTNRVYLQPGTNYK